MSAFNPAEFFEDVNVGRLIPLTRGYWTIVDEDDYEDVTRYKWHVRMNSSIMYAARCKPMHNNSRILMHRYIMNFSSPLVDHANGNGLDNRRRNLRPCSRSQNAANSIKKARPGLDSRYKGVCRQEGSGNWHSTIKINYRQISLGTYLTEIEAAIAYDRKAREVFGEFARTNFPEDDGRAIRRTKAGRRIFSDEDIASIKARLLRGDRTGVIALDFGVGPSLISNIKSGHTYK